VAGADGVVDIVVTLCGCADCDWFYLAVVDSALDGDIVIWYDIDEDIDSGHVGSECFVSAWCGLCPGIAYDVGGLGVSAVQAGRINYCLSRDISRCTLRPLFIHRVTAPADKKFTEPGAVAPVLPHRALFVI